MTIKAIVDRLRMTEGYSGTAIYAAGQEVFSENIERDYALLICRVLHSAAAIQRVFVTARGFTFVCFSAECYVVLLKLAGRFPAIPVLHLTEPEFVDQSDVLSLPSRATARMEAETALIAFGLLEKLP